MRTVTIAVLVHIRTVAIKTEEILLLGAIIVLRLWLRLRSAENIRIVIRAILRAHLTIGRLLRFQAAQVHALVLLLGIMLNIVLNIALGLMRLAGSSILRHGRLRGVIVGSSRRRIFSLLNATLLSTCLLSACLLSIVELSITRSFSRITLHWVEILIIRHSSPFHFAQNSLLTLRADPYKIPVSYETSLDAC